MDWPTISAQITPGSRPPPWLGGHQRCPAGAGALGWGRIFYL